MKTMPTAENTLRSWPEQDGHSVRASSENFWTISNSLPHVLQAYW
ncbi:hypothetical protein HDA43_005088 [Streptosporangium sandarakinum]|uniref:Uncharacterized protein n=1 Tax=Streptosporangium sandarakinum TaxID=1260955 RepID=A0A852UZ01_9ACTN|nr:hypothetical protein [Streptosporangium sandarakinum]